MTDLLLSNDTIVFSTHDFARTTSLSLSAAAHRLRRLAKKGFVLHLTKGIWAKSHHPYFTPLGCVQPLLGSDQGYVSFLSALHLHGLISQIPSRIQVATTGHSRIVTTPVGVFEFHQLHPRMMLNGVEWSDTPMRYRIATKEKALLDTLYLSTRKSRTFASLPELDRDGSKFNRKIFRQLLTDQVYATQIETAIRRRVESLRSL